MLQNMNWDPKSDLLRHCHSIQDCREGLPTDSRCGHRDAGADDNDEDVDNSISQRGRWEESLDA